MPNVITQGRNTGEFLVSEANGNRSREVATILADQVLKAGRLLGVTLVGASGVATALAGNAGNGAMGAITVGPSAKRGTYKLLVIEPASNAGMFSLEDPDGKLVPVTGDVAAAFSGGGLSFTLADNTDFQAGDGFTIEVSGGTEKWKGHDPDNTDGSQVARAVLWDNVDATGADKKATIIARDAEVNAHCLEYHDGATDNEKAAAHAQLSEPGIIVRS